MPVARCGGWATSEMMSPRLMSSSSSRVRAMDCGAAASSRSPSKVVMEATRLLRPEGSAMMVSPLRMEPAAICPAKPR